MIIEFAYTEEDLKEAGRAHARAAKNFGVRRGGLPWWIGWVIFGSLAVVFFILLQPSTSVRATPPIVAPPNQNPVMNILVPIIPWLLIFGFVWFFIFRTRLQGAKAVMEANPSLQLRRTLDADASRLIINDGQSRVEKKWTALRRFIESPNLFLLYTSDYAFDIVPKRAFASPAQVDEFRRLLEQQIQPPTGGFPVQPPGSS